MFCHLLLSVFLISTTILAPINTSTPRVTLDNGILIGNTANEINAFLGISFAKVPVGDLRFRLPEPPTPYEGVYNATNFGAACFQNAAIPANLSATIGSNNSALAVLALQFPVQSEDRLTINVFAPVGATKTSKLLVVAGALKLEASLFAACSGASEYNGNSLLERSTHLFQGGAIFVSFNYRLNGFGFLASKEVKAAGVGNLGLYDRNFSGDATNVTLWGESAGAISVGPQVVAGGGDAQGLFRGAFMQSGSPIAVGDITSGQPYYGIVVNTKNCTSAVDTLVCIRKVPYTNTTAAIELTAGAASGSAGWKPRVDGVFLKESPFMSVQHGRIAKIPIFSGDCDNEGTIFSLVQLSVTTDSGFRDYVKTNVPTTTSSPFGTGEANTSPLSSNDSRHLKETLFFRLHDAGSCRSQGESMVLSFIIARVHSASVWIGANVSIELLVSKRGKGTPVFGAFNASDLDMTFGPGELQDHLISFIVMQDPNYAGLSHLWPTWLTLSPELLTLLDGSAPVTLTNDTYQAGSMNLLNTLGLADPR